MPARKTKDVNQVWRTKIQTSMIINRLMGHIKGDVKMENSQVTAALGLLKKTAPDLSAVALGQNPELGPVKVEVGLRPTLSRDEWLKLHGS